ncbi:MAG: MBL fold metallo-hydrolase [Planctomycetes bacterium]|nr:MBL fold metallo-hydrolase [Planctomycetota bacterium]
MAATLTQRRNVLPLRETLTVAPAEGEVHIHWLGQSGFVIRTMNETVVIDPYLSDALAEKHQDDHFTHERMMPPPIGADELRGIDFLFATHDHTDHLDSEGVGAILSNNPTCRFVCPASIVKTAEKRGADPARIIAMRDFEKITLGGFEVEMLPSAHEEIVRDENGVTTFAGFVLGLGGQRLYHSGDCVPFPDQPAMVAERHPNVVLLPVNGRDAVRASHDILGNFTVTEAADLALQVSASHLIPHHFGMFDFNTVSREHIVQELEPYKARGLEYCLPDVATTIVVTT